MITSLVTDERMDGQTKVEQTDRQPGWLRGTVVERRSLTGELSLSYARPAADG